MNITTILVRAVVTAVEAALGVIVAAGTTNLNIETGEAALAAAIAAGVSVLYNAVRQWLDSQATTDQPTAEPPITDGGNA